MLEGTLIRGRGGIYTARDQEGEEYVLRAKKKFRRLGLTPLVGDRILFTPGTGGDEHGWLEEILPRVSSFIRPPVANVTLMVIVAAPEPEPDYLLIDRMLVSVRKAGMKALILVNKRDMDPTLEKTVESVYRVADVSFGAVSAKEGDGLSALPGLLRGETACFCGQSGVGKSTLINALLDVGAETGEISRKIQRGKNTTRHVELFTAADFRIMDTPGFSLFTLTNETEDPVLLKTYYPEFAPFEGACRFDPCYHDREPGCLVRRAAQEGQIDPARYERYTVLLAQQRENWRNRYD